MFNKPHHGRVVQHHQLSITLCIFIIIIIFNVFQIFNVLHGGQEDKYILSFASVLLHPFSKGSITLRSTNPFDQPIIEGNALADPREAQILAEGGEFKTFV